MTIGAPRRKPAPRPAECMSAASDDLFDGWFAYKKRSGEDVQKRRIGHGLNAPTSLTLRADLCALRSAPHAMKSQSFTIPWGVPREAGGEPDPKLAGPLRAGLGAFRASRKMIAASL